jgi:acetyl-CoA/propionyl-CoA carboxylase biotin carboxyl carrier protein
LPTPSASRAISSTRPQTTWGLTRWKPPSGPGVRVDGGFVEGDEIGGNFDSLLAKLIVTGATRQQALERSRRALAEFEIDGMPTALTFHEAVVADAALGFDWLGLN